VSKPHGSSLPITGIVLPFFIISVHRQFNYRECIVAVNLSVHTV
jgi:hypothetical protein